MATLPMQKDLVLSLKKETYSNVGILSKVQAMPPELSRQVFKENALDKPTQTLFNHLSHYLVSIIDHAASTSLPWPLYDTKTERAYRNQLSSFITDCSNKGLLSPVMSSYLVNPGCYKVTMLIFQMSQLAVQKLLTTKMKKDSQRKLYTDMTEKFKSQDHDGFMEQIEKETELMQSKFTNYLQKRKATEKMAQLLRAKISQMESKSSSAQKYLDKLVDGLVSKHKLDAPTTVEILKIKNVRQPSQFFENWLLETDRQIDEMESNWSKKMSPLLLISKTTQMQTESLISRCTGVVDKNTYMIEYNHKTDFICTKDLQNQVNSQQKYILKNIIKDERLNFPNLIRGFLIAIGFVLKNAEIGNEIYQFNEYLDGARMNYSETAVAMRSVMERLIKVEAKLQPSSPLPFTRSSVTNMMAEIPPLPDLSELLNTKALQCQPLFDSFTPLHMSKHQFNLRKRTNFSFAKPQPKSLLITPFCQRPKDDFLKSLISCRVSSYDRANLNANQNVSISQNDQVNETIAECSSGFTKQQIMRLFSTKKSSSKKLKYKTERPDIKIKKGGLLNETTNTLNETTNTLNESNCLFKSHSSPNLFENMENRMLSRAGRRKLSIMQEDTLSPFEVSGISALNREISNNTPPIDYLEPVNTSSMPCTTTSAADVKKFDKMLKEFNADMKYDTAKETQEKTETPKSNAQLIKKTSSLEKIINRFKKVRAHVLPDNYTDEFRSIAEEKENTFAVNRVLLPDLLSPNCSVPSKELAESENFDESCVDLNETVRRKPRESLGTVLGVDQTFLDQFDLVD